MTYFGNYHKHAPLQPHSPDTKIEILGSLITKVEVAPLALEKMNKYIEHCDDEIGWLGIVRKLDDYFLVEDVLLFSQEVTAVTTHIDADSLGMLAYQLMEADPVNGVETANAIRMWGHSHVNMQAAPSGQDDNQMLVFNSPGVEWFIRAIGNKQGKLRFDVFHFNLGLVVQDVKWCIHVDVDNSLDALIKEEIKQKVRKKPITQYLPNRQFGRGVFRDDDDDWESWLHNRVATRNDQNVIDAEYDAYDHWLQSYGKVGGYNGA